MKVFRDPVHGDIFLPRELVELLDTVEMQRLRGIKQLGTASLVYPGAVHTRFEHSLGTCYLVYELWRVLEEGGARLREEELLALGAAALLHDVGHIPYGHTIEDERRIFGRHDGPERLRHFLGGKGDLARHLQRLGIASSVWAILQGEAPQPWQSELISGVFCADLLDYLARDAFFCGLSQNYDRRILRSLRLHQGHLYLECQKEGIVREDLVSEVINLLRLRYFLTERVFFHHTKSASGAMISKIIERALELGLKLEDILPLGDERLLTLIDLRWGEDLLIRSLLQALAARQIYKRAYVLTRRIGSLAERQLVARYHVSSASRQAAEEELCGLLNFKPGELIIYCPAAEMQLKEAEVLIKIDPQGPRSLASLKLPEVEVLREKHRNLWRFYVLVAPKRLSRLKKISQVCERYFQLENHLPVVQSSQLYLAL